MRTIFVAIFGLLLVFCSACSSQVRDQDSVAEKADPAVATQSPLITKSVDLPASVDLGEFIRVEESLAPRLDLLLTAAAVNGEVNAQCEVKCDHEIGGITCPVGKQCSCGCPGGYAYCSCKN